MTMTLQKSNLKAAILLPLALVLIILLAVFIYSYSDAEKEFTDEYVSSTFQSTTRAFDSYLQADTETLSASLYLLMQDDALRRALAAQDRDALLQRAEPCSGSCAIDTRSRISISPDRTASICCACISPTAMAIR